LINALIDYACLQDEACLQNGNSLPDARAIGSYLDDFNFFW
jgi:hypothetical protein